MNADENNFIRNQLNIYLNEYQACYRQRNHYDSLSWTIGSLFIAASFTLFGFSFQEYLINNTNKEINNIYVIFLSIISIGLIFIWYFYNQNVNPWVLAAIIRMHQIEIEITDIGFDIQLQNLVHTLDVRAREHNPFFKRGVTITFVFFIVSILAWVFRYTMFYDNLKYKQFVFIVGIIIICLMYLLHTQIFNKIKTDEIIRNLREGVRPQIR